MRRRTWWLLWVSPLCGGTSRTSSAAGLKWLKDRMKTVLLEVDGPDKNYMSVVLCHDQKFFFISFHNFDASLLFTVLDLQCWLLVSKPARFCLIHAGICAWSGFLFSYKLLYMSVLIKNGSSLCPQSRSAADDSGSCSAQVKIWYMWRCAKFDSAERELSSPAAVSRMAP